MRAIGSLLLEFSGLRQKLGIMAFGLRHKLGVVIFCLSFELGVVDGGHPNRQNALKRHEDEESDYHEDRNAKSHFLLSVVFAVGVEESEWPNDQDQPVAAID